MEYINKIICGNDLEILPRLPAESVNCVTTSPPFWGLRDYGIEPVIWDGDKDCKHEWGTTIAERIDKTGFERNRKGLNKAAKIADGNTRFATTDIPAVTKKSNFCQKCGAWKGSLGLEPTFELYIKHLCDIFDEVKRVLRKDGTCWVNLGDSYWGSGQGGADYGGKEIVPESNFGHVARGRNYPNKSLCLIPQRFVIEMVNRGWIAHNVLIWKKPNCMPSSAKKRFTVDYEPVFFFSKSNKVLFWTNEKTLECVSKSPLGIKGLEGKDWEWRECPKCGSEGTIIGKALKEGAAPIVIGPGIVGKNTKAFKICPKCKGLKKVRYSFWTGHDYWFEQQFEEHLTQENSPDGIVRNRLFNYDSKLNKMRGYKTKQTEKEIQSPQYHGKDINYGGQGRNKRAVWTIPTQPYPEAHFAVYPEALIEPMIKAGCPRYVCKKCGKARVKIIKSKFTAHDGKIKSKYDPKVKDGGAGRLALLRQAARERGKEYHQELEFLGYTDCCCNAGWEGGIVLDPFIGAGTTALVALKQRKRFIGIEIKQEYIDMANKRIARVQQEIF